MFKKRKLRRYAVGVVEYPGVKDPVFAKTYYNNSNILGIFSENGGASGAIRARQIIEDLIGRYEDEKCRIPKRKVAVGSATELPDWSIEGATRGLVIRERGDNNLEAFVPELSSGGRRQSEVRERTFYHKSKSDNKFKAVSVASLEEGDEISVHENAKNPFKASNFLELVLKAANSQMYPERYWCFECREVTPAPAQTVQAQDAMPIQREPMRECMDLNVNQTAYMGFDGSKLYFKKEESDNAIASITKKETNYEFKKLGDKISNIRKVSAVVDASGNVPDQVASLASLDTEEIKYINPNCDFLNFEVNYGQKGPRRFDLQINPVGNEHASASLIRILEGESKVQIVSVGDVTVYGLSSDGKLVVLNTPETLPLDANSLKIENCLGQKETVEVETKTYDLEQYSCIFAVTVKYLADLDVNEQKIANEILTQAKDDKYKEEVVRDTLKRLLSYAQGRETYFSIGYIFTRPTDADVVEPVRRDKKPVVVQKNYSLGQALIRYLACGLIGGAAMYLMGRHFPDELQKIGFPVTHEHVVADKGSEDVKSLQARIKECEKQLLAKKDYDAVVKQAAELKKQMKQRNAELAVIRKERGDIIKARDWLQNKLKSEAEHVQNLEKTLDNFKGSLSSDKRKLVDDLNKQRQQYEKRVSMLETDNKSKSKALTNLEGKMKLLSNQLEDAKTLLKEKSADIEKTNIELNEMHAQYAKLETQLKEMRETKTTIKTTETADTQPKPTPEPDKTRLKEAEELDFFRPGPKEKPVKKKSRLEEAEELDFFRPRPKKTESKK
ncbi:hypothetical protein KY312_02400 [Candidatus Woesearchaeota archaeon]|nr:hypothetical protein [Candidatus Woesearchaeota archaeon]